mgnify:FL=1
MTVANVADIVGRRNLVEEAQGWAKIRHDKEKLAMLQKEKAAAAKKAATPKAHAFKFADWGSENQYMQEWMGDLQDKSTHLTMADAELLRIPYYDERCGAECQAAHQRLRNRHATAQQMKNLQKGFKTDYERLKKLMEDPSTSADYDNEENRAKLAKMEEEWAKGMKLDIDPKTGRLIVLHGEDVQVAKTNEAGQPLFLDENGNETPDPKSAAKDENGDPMLAMTLAEEKKWSPTTIDDYYTTLGLDSLAINAKTWNPQPFQQFVDPNLYDPDSGGYGDYDAETNSYNANPESNLYKQAELAIFGSHGLTSDGYAIVNSKTRPIIQMLKDQNKDNPSYTPTKHDIVSFVLQSAASSSHVKDQHAINLQRQKDAAKKGEDGDPNVNFTNRFSNYAPTSDLQFEGYNRNGQQAPGGGTSYNETSIGLYTPMTGSSLEKSGIGDSIKVALNKSTIINGGNNMTMETVGKLNAGSAYDFVYNNVLVLPRRKDTGRFMTEAELTAYLKGDNQNDPGDKGNIYYDIAVSGTFKTTDADTIVAWRNGGISKQDGLTDGLVPLSLIQNDVMSSSTENSPNPQVVKDMVKSAQILNNGGKLPTGVEGVFSKELALDNNQNQSNGEDNEDEFDPNAY